MRPLDGPQARCLWSARLADAPVSCMCCGADWGVRGAGLVGRPWALSASWLH